MTGPSLPCLAMSLNEMVISQSSAMGPCRTYNENIRLHTERTPCRVEDQWSGLMKGGWCCCWWLEGRREGGGERRRVVVLIVQHIIYCTQCFDSQRSQADIYRGERKTSRSVAFTALTRTSILSCSSFYYCITWGILFDLPHADTSLAVILHMFF